jgi:virulence-associated protein VapD
MYPRHGFRNNGASVYLNERAEVIIIITTTIIIIINQTPF